MRNPAGCVAMSLIAVGVLAGQGRAGVVTFIGEDRQLTANPTNRALADIAALQFQTAAAALGPVSTITFESALLGSFTNLTVVPGVSINGSDLNGNAQTIRDTTNFPSYPSVDGSNTTAGGSQFVEMFGGNLVFTFAQPTQFFGAYLTGVQGNFFPDRLTFDDGSSHTIVLRAPGTSVNVGEIAFIGFTDVGKSITSVTVLAGVPQSGQDAIGVDDVSFQAAVPVPEPSTVALGGIAMLTGFGYSRVRHRSK